MRLFSLVPAPDPANLNITIVIPPGSPSVPSFVKIALFVNPYISHSYSNPPNMLSVFSDAMLTIGIIPTVAQITHAHVFQDGTDINLCDPTAWAIAWNEYVSNSGILPTPGTDNPPVSGGLSVIDIDCNIDFDPTGEVPLQSIPGFTALFITPPIAPSYCAILSVKTDVGTGIFVASGTACF